MAQYQNAPMEGLEGQYDAPSQQLNEKQVCRVAEAIGRDFKFLGFELGLTEVELERIMEDNTTTIQKVHGMLTLWQRKLGDKATMDVLCKAISKKRSVVTINDRIIAEVISEMRRAEPFNLR